jgi:hypothetical protein
MLMFASRQSLIAAKLRGLDQTQHQRLGFESLDQAFNIKVECSANVSNTCCELQDTLF